MMRPDSREAMGPSFLVRRGAFLSLLGAATLNIVLNPTKIVAADSWTAQRSAGYRPLAYGHATSGDFRAYLPQSHHYFLSAPVDLRRIPIIGYTGDYRYVIPTPDRRLVEAPIESIDIDWGNPIPETRLHSKLGIRNDIAELMPLVPKMGASLVRISEREWDITARSPSITLLKRVGEHELTPLFVFNPRRLISYEQTKEQIKTLVENGIKIVEVGNEPDNPELLWNTQDSSDSIESKQEAALAEVAQLIKYVQTAQKELGASVQLVAGATVVPSNIRIFHDQLLEKGVDLSQVSFAVHAYNKRVDVEVRMDIAQNVTRRPIWITELGIKGWDKSGIIDLLDEAVKRNAGAILIHELPGYEDFGLMDHAKNKPTPFYYMVGCWSQTKSAAVTPHPLINT